MNKNSAREPRGYSGPWPRAGGGATGCRYPAAWLPVRSRTGGAGRPGISGKAG
jgi:hypothetical protein